MANKMLIDASHPEETRVVVLRGNRVEEFDFESASKRQLRGNIYLAKVTRVEPALQAAFIEYGGNRHGFLAFSEIHPDYYQIPVADRQALLEDEARAHDDEDEEQHRPNGQRRSRRFRRGHSRDNGERRESSGERNGAPRDAGGDDEAAEHLEALGHDEHDETHSGEASTETAPVGADDQPQLGFGDTDPTQEQAQNVAGETTPTEAPEQADRQDAQPFRAAADEAVVSTDAEAHAVEAEPASDGAVGADADLAEHSSDDEGEHGESHSAHGETHGPNGDHEDDHVEHIGGGDALDEAPTRMSRPRRHYKIQEVIKRRQILLVQVVKEERGNKGAALTTYLSLAGRYSVLMPNTARGGGISRKITDAEDRKRLKAIAQELEVPDGMGIILRTAGAARGIAEVKRDFEYLMRMWETVRETTLGSSAPTLVYEEGSLVKRAIRDLYNKEIDEVLVSGDEGFKEAREFMRLMMPSQARSVIAYREPQPLFAKHGVEAQLDAMFSNHVTLKSGGYLVINQTEALVAIDVNSGRSTREHNIEDTALRTNLEAADEVARQLRLRDLAGLIVVDFIDMEEGRNDRAVERRIKDALKDDRARIQIGRISHFGLLEMSRQRIRTGVLEGSTVLCPHCGGAGTVRSISSITLHILRLLEDALIKSASHNLICRTRAEVALYILNQKRTNLLELETRFGVAISVLSDPLIMGTVYHAIERGGEATPPVMLMNRAAADLADAALLAEEDEEFEAGLGESGDEDAEEGSSARAERTGGPAGEDDGQRRRRRRRRRRGGRDNQHQASANDEGVNGDGIEDEAEEGSEPAGEDQPLEAGPLEAAPSDAEPMPAAEVASPEIDVPAAASAPADAASDFAAPVETAVSSTGETAEPAPEAEAETPRRRRTRRTRSAEPGAETTGEPAAPARKPRRSRARVAEVAETETPETGPSADRDVGADIAKTHTEELPASAVPASAMTESEPRIEAPAPASTPEPVAVAAEPEPVVEDPNRPKRSGWWQRAKATFTNGS